MAKAKSSTTDTPEEEVVVASQEVVTDNSTTDTPEEEVVVEDSAKASDDGVTKIMTIGENPEGHNMETHTVRVSTSAVSLGKAYSANSKLVKVLINYPEGWTKDKFFKNGEIREMAPETANTFIEIGIATLTKE